jgi:hypothetical protein
LELLENFEKWKKYVGSKVLLAEKVGFSESTVTRAVDLMQNFLANVVEPQNPEEALLQKLYLLGNDVERLALSHLVVKLVKEEVSSDAASGNETKH